MRGSPLLRAGLVLFALLLLLFPLHSLTSRRPVLGAVGGPAPRSTLHLTITATTFPFRFSISHLGREVWAGESDASSRAKDLTLAFPPEGIDLLVEASWAEKKETAVRLEVARDAGAPMAKTLWGTERVNDVLSFQP